MINFTKTDLENRLKTLSKEMQDKLLMLSYEDYFRNIINYKNVKDDEIFDAVGYAARVVALGFASKQEMFDLILEAIGDEDEARHIFEEIDRTILVPNNFQGLQQDQQETPKAEVSQGTSTQENTTITTETAEDILKEIENPTPAPASLPVFKPEPVISTQAQAPELAPTQAPQQSTIQTQQPIQTEIPQTNTPINQTQPTPTQSNPVSMTMPTKEQVAAQQMNQPPQVQTNPNKESQLDSKLTDATAQPLKSTYYKIDPYREQTK